MDNKKSFIFKLFLQLHVPVQLPCYDFVPISKSPTRVVNFKTKSKKATFPRLQQTTSQTVTGGLYRAPVPIHRNFPDLRLLAIPPSYVQVAEHNPLKKRFRFAHQWFASD